MQDQIQQALQSIPYPGFTRDIVSFGIVHEVRAESGKAVVVLQVATQSREVRAQLRERIESALSGLAGLKSVEIEFKEFSAPPVQQSSPPPPPPRPRSQGEPNSAAGSPAGNPWTDQAAIPGIKRIIAVGSGKGGVGKSTIACNLACALQRLGLKVGLMDADIYGPSVHVMMGTGDEKPEVDDQRRIVPLERHGVKMMSIGFIVEPDEAMIWRGPMVMKAIQQFLKDVNWGEMDCLVVDMPPGTGDAQLTLVQQTPLSGAVVVSTPQEISLIDARRAVMMFKKVEVPILGLVENMSYFQESGGKQVELFDRGGVRRESEKQGVPYLGELALDIDIRKGGDAGRPIVVGQPDSASGRAFLEMARQVAKSLSLTA